MTADDDPELVTINAPWGSYQVQRGSLADTFLNPERVERKRAQRIEQARMDWSLGGKLADLLWMLVPETRPLLVDLAVKELADGVRYDRFLLPLNQARITDGLLLELLLPAMSNIVEQRDLVLRCLSVLHRIVVEDNGGFWWELVDDRIVRPLERNGFRDVLTEIHPEFMDLVRRTRTALGQD